MPFPQSVPAVYFRHPPAPSQVPSKPQVEASAAWQVVGSRGFVPAVRKVQMPIEPPALHVLHDSVQAALQHKPSTQKLLVQSDPHMHDWPLAFFVSASLLQAVSAAGASLGASPASLAVDPPLPLGPSDASLPECVVGELLPQPTPKASTSATPAIARAHRPDKPTSIMLR
jgi:hypothetical protein